MPKMFPPEDISGEPQGFGKRYADGSYNVPEDRAFEAERIHGFRRADSQIQLTRASFEGEMERHRIEMLAKDEEIKKLQAENQTIMSVNAELNRQVKDLAVQLHTRVAKAPPEPAKKV